MIETSPRVYSRGAEHSRKIKESPRWHEWQEKAPRLRRRYAERQEVSPDITKGFLLLAEKAWGRSNVAQGIINPRPFQESAWRHLAQCKWKEGYVQALWDVKAERERMERAAYFDAMPRATIQELSAISHVFDAKRTP